MQQPSVCVFVAACALTVLPLTPCGFDNSAESLHVSSYLLENYLEAAERVLDAAIANRPRPAHIQRRLSIKDERTVKPTGSVTLQPPKDRKFTMGEVVDLLNEAMIQQRFILVRRQVSFTIPLDDVVSFDFSKLPHRRAGSDPDVTS